MTVEQLIKELSTMPGDLAIYVPSPDDDEIFTAIKTAALIKHPLGNRWVELTGMRVSMK